MSALATQAEAIVRLVHTSRIDLANEKMAQEQIGDLLTAAGLAHRREVRLSARDIPDFLLDGTGLAVEVKIKGAIKRDTFRQLCRYAEHDQVQGLLLATGAAMGLPPEIGGKPAFYASLGRAWL